MMAARWCQTWLFLLLFAALPVSAHNVVGSVFVDGDLLEGAFGFSNGDLAPSNAPVQLLSPEGSVVATTVTDEQGEFAFRVTEALAYQIVADLGQGHLGTVEVFPEDIVLPTSSQDAAVDSTADILPEPATAAASSATSSVDTAASSLVLIDPAALDATVNRAVAAQLKPLRRDLLAMQSATRLSDILGGLGVIIGLCGGAAFWLARRSQGGSR